MTLGNSGCFDTRPAQRRWQSVAALGLLLSTLLPSVASAKVSAEPATQGSGKPARAASDAARGVRAKPPAIAPQPARRAVEQPAPRAVKPASKAGVGRPVATKAVPIEGAAPKAMAKVPPPAPPRGPSSWRQYAKLGWRRGYVTLHSPGIDRRWTGYVLGPGNTLLPRAEEQIRRVLASWRTGRSRGIDRRLIRLIAHVSDVFGGRPIRVVSGFRETSHAKNSHHKKGEALDFSIDGVPNWALRDYLRSLDHTGVGYYPNSSFVHLDVRDLAVYWVDLSRPGAPPRYVLSGPRHVETRED